MAFALAPPPAAAPCGRRVAAPPAVSPPWYLSPQNSPHTPSIALLQHKKQVQSELAVVDKTNMQVESFARTSFAPDCEAAINEQIKCVAMSVMRGAACGAAAAAAARVWPTLFFSHAACDRHIINCAHHAPTPHPSTHTPSPPPHTQRNTKHNLSSNNLPPQHRVQRVVRLPRALRLL